MALRPLPDKLPDAQTELIAAKERILELRTMYADRHQRILDQQSDLRVILNTQFENLRRVSNDMKVTQAAINFINAAFARVTAEMQAVEDTEPDKPIDEFPDRDLPAKPGAVPVVAEPIEVLDTRG